MNLIRCLTFVLLAALVSFAVPQQAPAVSDDLKYAKYCRKAMTIKGRAYTEQRRKILIACADKLLRCELDLEVDGVAPGTCRSRATDFCKRKLGPAADSTVNKVRARFDLKATTACTSLGIAALLSNGAGGLGFVDDGDCGGAATVAQLVACIGDQLEIEADNDVGRLHPRAGMLMDNAGLGSEYPNLPRPPTIDVLVSATAPASCTLVDPGVIAVAPGEALRLSGDESTLSVGGGKNGRLTLQLSLDPNDPCGDPLSLQGVIREPYGATEAVTFGPFTTDRVYCLTLKDSQCNAQLTGTLDVQ